jgi:hypothetical protein
MDDKGNVIWSDLMKIYDDIDPSNHFPDQRPLLAHYTSLTVAESILKHNEIWLSNPLFMNDYEELAFGLQTGRRIIEESKELEDAFGDGDLHFEFISNFDGNYRKFENEEALEVFIACFSKHETQDNDGILSMWRGYGHDGKGVAFIFDTSEISVPPVSPLILAPIQYATTENRIKYLNDRITYFAKLVSDINWERRYIYLAANVLFERLMKYSLFTKHIGFSEENEWRIVYTPSQDKANALSPMIGYHNGPRGIEPKMRLKIEAIPGVTADDFGLDKTLHGILLGPSGASILAESSFKRMLKLLGKPDLVRNVRSSKIPFRPTPY